MSLRLSGNGFGSFADMPIMPIPRRPMRVSRRTMAAATRYPAMYRTQGVMRYKPAKRFTLLGLGQETATQGDWTKTIDDIMGNILATLGLYSKVKEEVTGEIKLPPAPTAPSAPTVEPPKASLIDLSSISGWLWMGLIVGIAGMMLTSKKGESAGQSRRRRQPARRR